MNGLFWRNNEITQYAKNIQTVEGMYDFRKIQDPKLSKQQLWRWEMKFMVPTIIQDNENGWVTDQQLVQLVFQDILFYSKHSNWTLMLMWYQRYYPKGEQFWVKNLLNINGLDCFKRDPINIIQTFFSTPLNIIMKEKLNTEFFWDPIMMDLFCDDPLTLKKYFIKIITDIFLGKEHHLDEMSFHHPEFRHAFDTVFSTIDFNTPETSFFMSSYMNDLMKRYRAFILDKDLLIFDLKCELIRCHCLVNSGGFYDALFVSFNKLIEHIKQLKGQSGIMLQLVENNILSSLRRAVCHYEITTWSFYWQQTPIDSFWNPILSSYINLIAQSPSLVYLWPNF